VNPFIQRKPLLQKKELDTVTIIRFVAALWVFSFHFRMHIAWVKLLPEPYINFLVIGAVGMSLFFILSGFILTYNYDTIPLKGYMSYLKKRFARIYPAYVASVLLTLLVVPVTGNTLQKIFIGVADVFLLQAWFPVLFANGHHSGTWSLSVEAFFYVLFPLLLAGLLRLSWPQKALLAGVCYVASALSGYSLVIFPDMPFPVIYAFPIFRVFEFVFGMVLGFAYRQELGKAFFERWSWALLLALFGMLTWYVSTYGAITLSFVGHNAFMIPCLGGIIFLSAYCPIRNGFLKFLGESSYSFYLFQFIPLILLKQHLAAVRAIPGLNDVSLLFWLTVIATQILASLGYLLVERPFRRWIVGGFPALVLKLQSRADSV
jgi:peptidoglycan/LPS O-acetylase OafA/YrhL